MPLCPLWTKKREYLRGKIRRHHLSWLAYRKLRFASLAERECRRADEAVGEYLRHLIEKKYIMTPEQPPTEWEPKRKDWEYELIQCVLEWHERQYEEGSFALMGPCPTCGFERCHGCICTLVNTFKERMNRKNK